VEKHYEVMTVHDCTIETNQKDSEPGLTQDGSVLQPLSLHGGLPIHFGNTSKPLNRDGQVPALADHPCGMARLRCSSWDDQFRVSMQKTVARVHGVEPWRGARKSVRPIHNVIS
jgi:hypothetical protein